MTSLNSYIQNNPPPTTGNSAAPSFLQKNVFTPIKQAFSSGMQQAGEALNSKPGFENTLKLGSGLVSGTVGALAAPITNPTLGAASNTLQNKLADAYGPDVQRGLYEGGKTTAERVLEDTSNGANIAGAVIGGVEGVRSIKNIWEKAYNGSGGVDAATQGLENQSRTAVAAQQNIDTSVNQFQKGLGTSFGDASKQIEQINPQARVTIPNELMDKLNALKDTKKFALPDYLRTSSSEFGDNIQLGDIEKGGISITPSEMQDLIARMNKLTYAAKASGDLEVNQSTIGLNKDLHSVASDAFGNIKDATGNTIWDKAYENYSKGINAVDKISDIFNSKKITTPSDFNKTMDTIKNLSKDPQGKVILQNAIEEFKQTSGIDLTNPTAEISKILDSEEFLKESQKPSFLGQTFNKQYMSRTLVRIVEYAVFGTIIRNLVKSANQ